MTAIAASYPRRLGALMERERQTRFAGGVIGAYWAFLTPIAWIGFVVLLFDLLERAPPIYVGPEIFVATGVLPYIAFRQTITSMARAGSAHRYLLYIRPVEMSDILLATALLEAMNFLVTAIFIFGATTLIFGAPLPDNPGQVLVGLALAWMFATGLGRLIASIGLVSDSFARVVPILLRPLFWVSGIFYTATELPGVVQDLIWYSPLIHAIEIVREGYFLGYTSPIATPWYIMFLATAFYLLSLPISSVVLRQRRTRYRL